MQQELMKIVQTVSKLHVLYEYPEPNDIQRNWRKAFEWFLKDFAFVRAGAPESYSKNAIKALNDYDKEYPDSDFAQILWQNFEYSMDGKKTNEKSNPLFIGNNSFAISHLVYSLKDYNYNLVGWAVESAKQDNIEYAWNHLHKVRGIGDKITSMFFRDVIGLINLDEAKITDKVRLQPIDIWTARGAKAFSNFTGKKLKNSTDSAHLIIKVSEQAGVKPTHTNHGLWLLGSQSKSEEHFLGLLSGHRKLQNHLEQQTAWHQRQAKALAIALV